MVCLLDAVIFLSVDIRRMGDGLREVIKTEMFAKSGWFKESDSFDRDIVHLAWQEVTFQEECRKIKGFRSLREEFYTQFKPQNVDWSCDVAKNEGK